MPMTDDDEQIRTMNIPAGLGEALLHSASDAIIATDREGRYTLRELPFGPYVLSVHSRGWLHSAGSPSRFAYATFVLPSPWPVVPT